jgi:hypothetical protein
MTPDSVLDATSTSGTSLSVAFNNVAGNVLYVVVEGDGTSDYISGVTYNGVALSLIAKIGPSDPAHRWLYLFGLLAPATGSHNIVVSASSSTFIDILAASYSGHTGALYQVVQTYDGSDTPAINWTAPITTGADNSWTLMAWNFYSPAGIPPTGGTGTTRRVYDTEYESIAIFDSNGAISPAGATSLTANFWTTQGPLVIIIGIAPASSAVAVDDAYTTAFESLLTVPGVTGVLANDTPSTGVTAVLDADVSNGTLSLAFDGSFTYQPDAAFTGTDTFTYHTTDGVNDSNIATVTITVTALTIPRAGTNPPYAEIPTTFPLLFMELKVGNAVTAYAETPLNDNATWTRTIGTSKRKGPKILRVSSIRRELSNQGGFGTSQVTVELSDEDREFRTLCANATITNSYCALYIVDDSVRRAEGEPFRVFAGVVAEHRALSGFRYELTIEDALGAYYGNAFQQPYIPPHVLSIAEFAGMDPALEGRAGPIAFGELSDASLAKPQGVVPALFLGYNVLRSITAHTLAVNTLVDAYVFCEHSVSSIAALYYNPPIWATSLSQFAGDLAVPTQENDHIYRCSTAGTSGLSEPTWPTSPGATVSDGSVQWTECGSWDGTQRFAVPSAAYGTVLTTPHMPNWTAATGLSVNYVDYGGRRYTPMFVLRAHRYAKQIREGNITITANMAGADANGNATGTAYSAIERMMAQMLVNYVFTSYAVGSFNNIPFFPANSYTVMDTDTLDAAQSVAVVRLAGGYVGGVLYGADGGNTSGYDAMRDFGIGGDFENGTNRHGQLVWARDNTSATPVVSFTAQGDILDGTFEMWNDRTEFANQLRTVWAERYMEVSLRTPTAGNPLPRDSNVTAGQWVSSLYTMTDAGAVANYRSITIAQELENRVTRHTSTAISVASFTFARKIGPSDDGPWKFRFSTGLQGYGKGTARVDLGSAIQFEIPERLGTVASSPVIGYVTSHELDPQTKTVTLEGRVLR